MKLGVALLVVGVVLLVTAIPYSVLRMISAVNELAVGNISAGASAYYGIIGVVLGFVLTTIGAVRLHYRR